MIGNSCALKHPRQYMFCQMKSESIAECSIDGMNTQRIPTSMMLDPPYICMPFDEHKDLIENYMTNEKGLEACLSQ